MIFACLLAGRCLTSAGLDDVLEGWFEARQRTSSWSADFIQTRTLKALTHPLMATGRVDYAMSGAFRWEVGQPARTIAVSDGRSMFVVYPLLKRAERYPLADRMPPEWRDMMSLLLMGFPRSRPEFEARFEVRSVSATNGIWDLVMAPRGDAARRMMPEVRLALATNNFSLVATEMTFADGSVLRNDFTNGVLDRPLAPALFHWEPPPDYKITEPFAQ